MCDRGRCSSEMLKQHSGPPGLTLHHISLSFSSDLLREFCSDTTPQKSAGTTMGTMLDTGSSSQPEGKGQMGRGGSSGSAGECSVSFHRAGEEYTGLGMGGARESTGGNSPGDVFVPVKPSVSNIF